MHDGLAQVLGYMNLQVQTLGTLLQQGKSEQLQNELDKMRQAVKTAHADVRENILSLRTTLAQEKGLAAAVQEYLAEFEIQTGIETQFAYQMDGDLNLTSVAEVQLVCILQEALTNVRKHAHASQVSVSITKESQIDLEEILMSIKDNGVGFTLAVSKRSFGVQTMRERAESVSGMLKISSQPGHGTRVECSLPCMNRENLRRQSVITR
jgi:nitrate/nitrite-specific signal transduction histidine kinase